MVDGLVYVLENAVVRYTAIGEIPRPLGTRHPAITPFQGFQTKDSWIIVAIGNDNLWKEFCEAILRPDLAEDPEFETNGLRTGNVKKLIPILEEIMKTKTTEEWIGIFKRYKLPCSPINTIKEVVQDPNINYRRMIAEIDQPGIGKIGKKIPIPEEMMSDIEKEIKKLAL